MTYDLARAAKAFAREELFGNEEVALEPGDLEPAQAPAPALVPASDKPEAVVECTFESSLNRITVHCPLCQAPTTGVRISSSIVEVDTHPNRKIRGKTCWKRRWFM